MRFSIFLFLFLVQGAFAEAPAAEEKRLSFLDTFRFIPRTGKRTLQTSFSRESLPYWGAVVGSTAVLYVFDEEIYKESQRKGRDWGIGNRDNTKTVVSYQHLPILRLPSDTGSALYFIGDGWTHMGIAAGFLGTGYATDSTRQINTGYILMHGIFVSTLFNQALKRSFGRESPNTKTHPRGAWHPFPSFQEYGSKTGSYDAMPTGHVMTATLTTTILAGRYPEHATSIYVVGGLLNAALAFEMMNNGVHWASDYPLGIAMGIVIGNMALKMGEDPKNEKPKETSWLVLPNLSNGATGLLAMRRF